MDTDTVDLRGQVAALALEPRMRLEPHPQVQVAGGEPRAVGDPGRNPHLERARLVAGHGDPLHPAAQRRLQVERDVVLDAWPAAAARARPAASAPRLGRWPPKNALKKSENGLPPPPNISSISSGVIVR